MLGNECPDCGVRLRNGKCPECGWVMVLPAAPPKLPDAYREFPERSKVRADPTDLCEHCGKTVREHIAETLVSLARIVSRMEA